MKKKMKKKKKKMKAEYRKILYLKKMSKNQKLDILKEI